LATSAVAVAIGAGTSVRAIPVPEPPRSQPAGASPTPAPSGATLPFGSSILFVLDDAVNSGSTPIGTTVRMHLRSPLVVNGVTLAPAGTPGSFSVVSSMVPFKSTSIRCRCPSDTSRCRCAPCTSI
jgi:hypothetical protein